LLQPLPQQQPSRLQQDWDTSQLVADRQQRPQPQQPPLIGTSLVRGQPSAVASPVFGILHACSGTTPESRGFLI